MQYMESRQLFKVHKMYETINTCHQLNITNSKCTHYIYYSSHNSKTTLNPSVKSILYCLFSLNKSFNVSVFKN